MPRRDLGSPPGARKPTIVSFGELLWDVFPDTRHLGGSAANLAFHVAQQGAESLLISRVGEDEEGKLAKSLLADAGVRVDSVLTDPSHPTGRVEIDFVEGEPRFTIGAQVAWDHISWSPETEEKILRADVICFSTLAQRTPLVRKRLEQLLTRLGNSTDVATAGAPNKRPLRALDLNLRPPFVDLETIFSTISQADLVKLNEHELYWMEEQLQNQNGARWLLDNSPARLVVVTEGAKGARMLTHTSEESVVGHQVQGGDPVGAGDSFLASLAVALADGETPVAALGWANRYAAWVASQPGAMPGL